MQYSPLHAMHQALGAVFTEMAGWELPRHFGNFEAEYQAVRQSVGLCDLSYRGVIRVTGSERQRFLHAMVSNDTARLQPGQGCYTTFLTHKGKLVADFVVYADADAYILDVEPQVTRSFLDAIEQFVISEDVTFHNARGQWGVLSLQGPRAADLLALVGVHDVLDLSTYSHTMCDLAGQQVRLIRRSHTGELGYQLMAPRHVIPAVWQALWQHRETCAARAVGLDALEVIRIEAGLPLYGRDMTDDTIPLEANLEQAISYTKGCYIGQEVIARIESRGHVNRKLVGLLLEGDTIPASGAPICSSQHEVGWVTSATYSPARQQNVALGYVRREVWTPGTALAVQAHGTTLHATVEALPFYQV